MAVSDEGRARHGKMIDALATARWDTSLIASKAPSSSRRARSAVASEARRTSRRLMPAASRSSWIATRIAETEGFASFSMTLKHLELMPRVAAVGLKESYGRDPAPRTRKN